LNALRTVFSPGAAKALLSLPRPEAIALRDKIEQFAADPGGRHRFAKSFGGGRGRIRQGDWRAVYRVVDDTLIIEAVAHRREVYR
jgi:mRNA interferase RelE/StbE